MKYFEASGGRGLYSSTSMNLAGTARKLGVEERCGSTYATCKEINVLVLRKPTLQLIDYVLQQP